MVKPVCIICDLDGTLASGQHRWGRFNSGLITKEQLFSYEEAINDSVVADIDYLIDNLNDFNNIVILTARHKDRDERVTLDWLENNNIMYTELIMDPDNLDSAVDFKVKAVLKLQEKYNIAFALEDNPETVAAFRKLGITTLQVGYNG